MLDGGMDSLLSGSDYNQLRAFVAVGELLSFSRAAEALGVSSSALSQLVRGFEERVGVRLLQRTTRSVALTAAGEMMFRDRKSTRLYSSHSCATRMTFSA